MEARRLETDAEQLPSSSGEESSVGWPFGLSVIHTPDQFTSLQATFLLPFYSDADAASSSASDTDTRSEAASSFFCDSRRITLGSLIALPDLESASLRSEVASRRRSFPSSCGILELLGPCGPTSSAIAENVEEFVTASSESVVDCDTARTSVAFEDALRSPEWNEDQFASCHSTLSGGEWTGRRSSFATPVSVLSTPPRSHRMQRMSRSSSMKSFFSSLCSCRIDAGHAEQQNF